MAYESNCAMLYISAPQIKVLQRGIDKNDIYDPMDAEMKYGMEKEHHITLLFGLEPTVPIADVQKILNKHTFVRGKLVNASFFRSEMYDVLKFDVDEESAKRFAAVNADLCKLPYKTDFPDYHPHCTVCYLNPGAGDKYVVLFQYGEIEFTPEYAVYSEVNGAKSTMKIATL